jgi:hypothetical protein
MMKIKIDTIELISATAPKIIPPIASPARRDETDHCRQSSFLNIR